MVRVLSGAWWGHPTAHDLPEVAGGDGAPEAERGSAEEPGTCHGGGALTEGRPVPSALVRKREVCSPFMQKFPQTGRARENVVHAGASLPVRTSTFTAMGGTHIPPFHRVNQKFGKSPSLLYKQSSKGSLYRNLRLKKEASCQGAGEGRSGSLG